MISHTITALPTAPQTSDPVNFRARGDAFLSSLNTFDGEMNDVITDINATATTINNDATTASNAKDAAVASADFKGTWSSTTAYTVGQSVYYSGIIYRSLQAGTNKQPDTQTAYWASIATASNALLALINQKVGNTGNETISGVYTFSSSPILPVPTLANQAIGMGNIIEKTSTGIGYGTGSGGTVTQLTSKSTAVTLNKPCGQITMHNASLAAGAEVSFTLSCNLLTGTDMLFVSYYSPVYETSYAIKARCGAGSAIITIRNILGATPLAEAVLVYFAVIKGATA